MTARELQETWDARDSRYAASRHTLSDEAIDAVRSWRLGEVRDVTDNPADVAANARLWTPPPRVR